MKPLRSLLTLLAAILSTSASAQPIAQPAPGASGQLLVRANLGIDVIGGGMALGGGAGFRPLGGNTEYVLDVFRSSYDESYADGSWDYDYSESLTVIALRAQWLMGAGATGAGGFALAGAGVFAAALEWTEDGVFRPDPTGVSPSHDGAEYTASGTIFALGLGYAFTPSFEARVEVPVMVFIGDYGRASAVAIPINASLGLRF